MAAPVASLMLLGVMQLAKSQRLTPADAEPYHQQVKLAADAIPYRIGQWVGSDQDVPPSAIRLLQPNVLFNRLKKSNR